jgi:hypothetical protein
MKPMIVSLIHIQNELNDAAKSAGRTRQYGEAGKTA